MATKLKLILILAVVVFAIMGTLMTLKGDAEAKSSSRVAQSPLIWFQNPDGSFVEGFPEVEGSKAVLRRTTHNIQPEWDLWIRTSELAAGHVFSVWWVIFNYPDLCSPPSCGEDDLPPLSADANPAIMASALTATGGVTGDDGKGHFRASIKEGNPPGWVLFGPGLLNAEGAEVHVILRDHGLPISFHDDPSLGNHTFTDQITTYGGGCDNGLPPEAGKSGTFFCYEPQLAVFTASTRRSRNSNDRNDD